VEANKSKHIRAIKCTAYKSSTNQTYK